ncbi:MAG: hypothetical protein ACN6PJ_29680 [Achromobacter sp.]|uniref:hypothetical protein n=1 Tax=Achromobacter sp. TaxID=134375 RepID=UPI003D052C11
MPRINTIQTNFTAGEISPKVRGRVDVARYQNGAEALRNVIVNVYGGAERTPGTRMISPVKNESQATRLIPFVFNRDVAYVLEFGNAYMRVYRAKAGQIVVGAAPYEIATPWGIGAVPELRFAQKDTTMFITHPQIAPQILQRLDETNWRLRAVPFSVVPFAEIGITPSFGLTLSSASVGPGRTLTAAGGIFLNSDVGRQIIAGPGIANITGFVSSTVVTADIASDFLSTSIGANGWTLAGSPLAAVKPSEKGTAGKVITLTMQSSTTPGTPQPQKAITNLVHNTTTTARATVAAHGYSTGDTVRIENCLPSDYNKQTTITVVDANNFDYSGFTVSTPAPTAFGTAQKIPGAVTTGYDGFRPSDVGQYLRINRGLVLITEYVDARNVRGVVRADLDSDVESPAGAWSLEQSVWSPTYGYPTAVTINQQRLVFGGTQRDPNGCWGSRTGLYFDFTLGDLDTDAFFYALDGESNGIQHLASVRALLALTLGTEWTLAGGVEKPLTPTNVQAKDQSVYGTTDVRPARIGDELVFVQRAGTSVLAMSYNVATDSYRSPDLTTLSEHLLQSGVMEMAYQQKPVSVLWCVCADGSLATMTIDRDEGVVAWTRQETDGAFESVCVVPAGDVDEVWVSVRRTVNGVTRRYVERFDPTAYCHSTAFGTDPVGKAVWGGLDHLEGKTVACNADGAKQPPMVVSGGQVVLPRPAKQVQFGLPVVPRVKLLRPEIGTPTGTAQASNMRAHEFYALFLDTVGTQINGKPVNLRKFGPGILDQPPAPYSGWEGVGATGWEKGEMFCEFTQPDPMPFHLLAVVRKWTTND